MRVGVLGIGKTPHKIQHDKSLRDLIVDAGRLAMDDAGVEARDVQAYYLGNAGCTGFCFENSVALMGADHLGLVPSPAVRVEAACGTGAWALHLGCVAILSGLYDTVLVMGAEKMNDLATVEGTSTSMGSGPWYAASDTLDDAFALLAKPAEKAYAMAGVGPTDVDVAEIYNSFAIQEPLGVESLGFAERGEGWRGALDGSTWIDGQVGVNLSGGLLCKGHPLGATGTSQAVDLVEQLRGTAPEGIQRKDAEIGMPACRGGPGAEAAIHVYQGLAGGAWPAPGTGAPG